MGPSFDQWEGRRGSQARGKPELLYLPKCVCVCVCVHMCRGYPGSPWVPEEGWGLPYPIRAGKAILPMGYSQDQKVHLAVSDSVLEKGPKSFYRASLDFAKNCQAFKIQPLLTNTHYLLNPSTHIPQSLYTCSIQTWCCANQQTLHCIKIEAPFQDLQATDTLENCLKQEIFVAKARNTCYKVALPVRFPLRTIINKLKEEATRDHWTLSFWKLLILGNPFKSLGCVCFSP